MVFTFQDAENYLNDTAPPGKSVYGLGRINHLLDLLDHPENNFKLVTIVGTNGKGSTLAFMDSILGSHGLKVGCHIKPHLECVTERVRLDGIDISRDDFASTMDDVKTTVDNGWSREDSPTYFELIFSGALLAMKNARIDIALLETGLGGRLDAVNSVDADLVVMTTVDYDHTDLLGNTLTEISGEKIVVVRPGSTLVCQENPEEVLSVVSKYSSENAIDLVRCQESIPVTGHTLGLEGPWQVQNASLAVTSVNALAEKACLELFQPGILQNSIIKGLESARLPGRWERFDSGDGGRSWIIDGAHNQSGLDLVLGQYRNETNGLGTIIFGMKKSKDLDTVLPLLLESCMKIIFVRVPYLESFDPPEMVSRAQLMVDEAEKFSQIQLYCEDSIDKALVKGSNVNQNKLPVLVTGSLYLAGAARTLISNEH